MNKLLFILVGIVAFLTSNYLLLSVIPVMMWVFKDEAKKKARTVFVRSKSRIEKTFSPVLSVYSFNE